ncbi:MAG: eCIS core domain-containing protein [Acidobacteriota bacterium]
MANVWTPLRLLAVAFGCQSWNGTPPPGWQYLPVATCQQLQPFFPELDLGRDVLWRVDNLPWWLCRLAVVPPVAITFGALVWVIPRWYAPATPAGLELIAHELTHVVQYRRYGCVGFTLRYALNFFANLLHGDSLARAYENITFEVQARTHAAAIVGQCLFV